MLKKRSKLPTNISTKISHLISGRYRLFTALIFLIILLPAVYFSLKNPSSVAAWWNDNWQYRQRIPITNNTSQESNVYIAFDVGDVLDTSDTTRFQEDCGDIRFTNQEGQLLKYIVNSGCGTASTDIDVFFESFPAGDMNIYMYYGNSSVEDSFETAAFSTEATNYTIGTPAAEETTPGPVAYWNFDEGYGTTAHDATSQGNDGTITGATWQSEDMCISGKCLEFDGSDDEVSIPDPSNNALDPTSTLTIEAWINPKSDGEGTFGRIISNVSSVDVYIENDAGDTVDFCAKTGDTTDTCSSDTIPLNQWTHIAIVYTDANTRSFYINGLLDTSNDSTNSLTNDSEAKVVGDIVASDRSFDGFIDEPKIYPYARSADQIKQGFLKGASSAGSGAVLGAQDTAFLNDGLVGYWKMDEASWNGTTDEILDSSGNGIHGTAVCDVTYDTCAGGVPTTGAGKFGSAGDFNQDGQTGNIDTTTSKPELITRSFWVYPESTPTNSQVMISTVSSLTGLGSDPDSGTHHRSRIELTSSRAVTYLIQSYTGSVRCTDFGSGELLNQTITSTNTIPLNQWSLITITTDFGGDDDVAEGQLFINGQLEASFTDPNRNCDNNNNYTWVGKRKGANRDDFNGKIDEFRQYNRILSPAEIGSLYNWAPGPIVDLRFEEGSGSTANDSSGNGNSVTLNNGPIWTQGKYGGGLLFDSSQSQYGSYTSFTQNMSEAFTMNAWVKPSDLTGSPFIVELHFGKPGLRIKNGGEIRGTLRNYDDSDWSNYDTTATINLNEWSFLSLIYDSNDDLKIYINGSEAYTDTHPNFIGGALPTTLQVGGRSGAYFNGVLDQIQIYNYARTPNQIRQDMGTTSSVSSGNHLPTPVSHWKFDEQQGTSTNNSTSTSYSGISTNATWKTKTSCKINGCMYFDGTGDFVDIGTGPTTVNTVSFWVNPDTTTEHIIDLNGSAYISASSGTLSATGFTSPTIYVNGVASTTLASGSWQHVTVTTTTSISATDLDIGRLELTDDFAGYIDEVKIYNSALTADQVKLDMNASSSLKFSVGNDEAANLSDGAGNPPVAEWKLDENTGTSSYDTSGNNHTLTPRSGLPSWVKGKYGSAIKTTSNGFYTADAADLDDTAAITVEAWVNRTTAVDWQRIMGKYYYNAGDFGSWLLWFDNADHVSLRINNGSTFVSSGVSSTTLDLNTWYHVVGTYDGTNVRIFVNGQQKNISATTSGNIPDTAYCTTIGYTANTDCTSSAQNVFFGSIDNAKIYNYARTPTQIAYDYNRGKPIAHWKLDECQGATAHDSSGNGNDGTITIGGTGTNTSIGTCNGSAGEAWKGGATGKFNSSLGLDGTDDYILSSFNSSGNYPELTVSTWVKWGAKEGKQVLINEQNTDTIWFNLDTSDSDKFNIYLGDTTNKGYHSTNASISRNEWVFLTATYSDTAGELKMYINGKLDKTVSTSGIPDFDTTMKFGSNESLTDQFDGQIDDIRIFNYALSASQVKTVMNEGSSVRFGP